MKTLLVLALTTSAALHAATPSWPQFRGPGGSGVADGEKPPVEFAPGRNEAWSVSVPAGASAPCIWDARIFLTAYDGGKLWTLCLDRATGRELWRRDAAAEKIEAFHAKEGSPAASTPATDGERVVVYFGSVGLVAYDFAGKELWRHKLPVAETNNNFGSGTSPILAGGLAVLVRDLANDSAILALDAATGAVKWRTERPGMFTGYSTPVLWEHDGVAEIVAPGGLKMNAYDLRTGAERWLVRELPAVNCASPVVSAGMLYFAGWSPAGEDAPMPDFSHFLGGNDADGDGALTKPEAQKTFLKDFFESNDSNRDGRITREEWDGMVGYLKRGTNRFVAVKPGGSGDITSTHIAWQKTKGLPYVPSPLLYRGSLYFVKDGGLLSCFDALNGDARYEQKRIGLEGSIYASPVAADGRIYLATLNGKVATLAAGENPEVLWRGDFAERISATPAIVDDTLYVRTATKLFAFRKK